MPIISFCLTKVCVLQEKNPLWATLGHYEGNFLKTCNSTLIDYIKCALCIFSLEIVKQHENHHELQALYKQASHVQKMPWTSIMSQRRTYRFLLARQAL